MAVSVLLAGCWDSVPIEQRGFLLAIGVDSAGVNEPGVRVSALIPQAHSAQAQQTDAEKGGGGEVTATVDVVGTYADDALARMRGKIGGVLDPSTIQYIVVGDSVRPEDLPRFLSSLTFTPFIPMTPLVIGALGSAQELLSVRLSGGQTLPEFIDGLQARGEFSMAAVRPRQEWEISATLTNESADISMPLFAVEPDPSADPSAASGGSANRSSRIVPVGVAVYDGAARTGIVSPEDAILFYTVADRHSPIGALMFTDGGRDYVVRLASSSSKVKVRTENGVPAVHVDVLIHARLWDSGDYRVPITDRHMLEALRRPLEAEVEKRLSAILRALQDVNSDAMRLYHDVRLKLPQMSFGEFKKIYGSMKADFHVTAKLTRVGLLS